ncbi:MAG: HAD family phosphatase [Myxococcales bacterium]|nr:HAD family phosphatase [Myxococcales bacterium]
MTEIRLVIADVDGTLVTDDKALTDRARRAVRALRERDIAFTITSGRPPKGLRMLIEPLELDAPVAAFNGGMLVEPDLSVIEEQTVPSDVVGEVIETLRSHQLDVWVYRGVDWLILRSDDSGHVDREQRTVQFAPEVVDDFDGLRERVVKIVGVSDDHERVARCAEDVRGALGEHVSATRSQPYYLDVTHPDANKGAVLERLSSLLDVPAEQIATIGDMPSDVPMFERSGLSIAMGNASEDVQRAADERTASNGEEGFAKAMERYLLGGG